MSRADVAIDTSLAFITVFVLALIDAGIIQL